MKKFRPIHTLFILLNLLGCIFEYFLVYKLIFRGLLNLEHLVSAVLTSVIFIVLFIVTIYTLLNNQKVFEEDKSVSVSSFRLSVIENIKKKYYLRQSKNIDISFVDGDLQPSIMFALLDNVYINTNKRYSYKSIDDLHFEGILAHEIGHTLHMSKVYAFANLRLTAIIGNLLFIDTINYSHKIGKKETNAFNYIVFGIKYTLFIIFNLINLLILYPFKRYEELKADELSLTVSNGYSLRGYYYKIYKNHNSKIEKFRFNFIDFNHPNPLTHYNTLNKLMVGSNKNCELYLSHQISVEKYFDEQDKYHQIINFIEKDVQTKLPVLYMYIGQLAKKNHDLDKAKEYFRLAGENNQLIGYRKLVGLLKLEGNLEEAMEIYKILAEKGDNEGKIYANYYNQYFDLERVIINEVVLEPTTNESIKLTLKNEVIYDDGEKNVHIKFNRHNKNIYLNNTKIYILEEDMIISKPFTLYDKETDEVKKIIEYFKKRDAE